MQNKGKQLLAELEEADVEEQDSKVLDWMCEQYLKVGKTTGNKKRTARHIRDFRIKSGIEKNNLIRLCLDFLSDEDNMDYRVYLELDDKDKKLLLLLQENSKRTNKQLANELNLSVTAVFERIKKLEKQKIINKYIFRHTKRIF